MYGMNEPLTGRYGMNARPMSDSYRSGFTPVDPVPFDSGFGEPEPAAASTLPNTGAQAKVPLGLDPSEETRVARQLEATPDGDEGRKLLTEWADLSYRIRQYLTAARAARIDGLRAQLDSVLEQGRASLDAWRMHNGAARAAQGGVNAHLETLAKARNELKTVVNSRPSKDQWPTAAEMAQYEERLTKAQWEADRVERHHAGLTAALDEASEHAQAARMNLDALTEQREQLQAQIDGKAHKGPFGLVVPAGEGL
jgi:hypothetical protein